MPFMHEKGFGTRGCPPVSQPGLHWPGLNIAGPAERFASLRTRRRRRRPLPGTCRCWRRTSPEASGTERTEGHELRLLVWCWSPSNRCNSYGSKAPKCLARSGWFGAGVEGGLRGSGAVGDTSGLFVAPGHGHRRSGP